MNTIATSPAPLAEIEQAIRTVLDPEFGLSVWDLGLIYSVEATPDGVVRIAMTLTTQFCPAGDVILSGVRAAAESRSEGWPVEVALVWEPAWTPEMISPAGRDFLGWQ